MRHSNQFFEEFKLKTSNIKDKQLIEIAYYEELAKCLKHGQFKNFKKLFNASIDFDIFIDVKEINQRFEFISKLLMNLTDRVSTEYRTSALGDQIDILRFCSLIHYIKNNFFNQYTIYGLSVRYLSSIRRFIDIFSKNYSYFKNEEIKEKIDLNDKNKRFMEFNVIYRTFYYGVEENREYREIKKHFISPENILKNLDSILARDNYNFYSLSMVLLGGLGPQGLGFTYSTPKGEIIEICSDQKENKAIIIKFKQFLKRQFLGKLEKELINFNIKIDIREKIIDYLSGILNPNELINYFDRDSILKEIINFINDIDEFQQDYKSELKEIIKKISKSISIIFRKIKLKDQFITRMDLVAKDKIKSEDIAKLTSLRGKSHYDVLRERFFFQYIVDWFFNIYCAEKEKNY